MTEDIGDIFIAFMMLCIVVIVVMFAAYLIWDAGCPTDYKHVKVTDKYINVMCSKVCITTYHIKSTDGNHEVSYEVYKSIQKDHTYVMETYGCSEYINKVMYEVKCDNS